MFKCGVHYGHNPCYWNPKTSEYVFGKHPDLNLHVINLDKTLVMFEKSLLFVRKLAQSKGRILFVGTKRNAQEIVKTYASNIDMPYVVSRWLGGMLTNFRTIKRSVDVLKQIEQQFENDAFDGYTKKERLTQERRLNKLRNNLGGIKDMKALPDAIFVIDVNHERIAVQEANKLGIPVIGVVDTNASPDGIDYVIPGNDDAVSAIHYYVKNMATIIEQEQEKLAVIEKEEAARAAEQKPKIIREEAKAAKADDKKEEVKAKAEAPKKRVVKKAEDSADDADAKAKKVVKKKTVAKADDAKEAKPAKKTVAKKTTAKKTADSAESKTATKAKSTKKETKGE